MQPRGRLVKDSGLNTTVPPNGGRTLRPTEYFPPVTWTVWFHDGSSLSSKESSWTDFSELVTIDEVRLHLSRQPMQSIVVHHGDRIYALDMEQPACCFGFHRWRVSASSEQEWLYSAFGFFRPDERVILQVSALAGRVVLQNRTMPLGL